MKAWKNKKAFILLTLIGLLLTLTTTLIFRIIYIKKQTQSALANAQKELTKQNIVKHKKEAISPLDKTIDFLGNNRQVKGLALYQDNYFVATSSGLIKYSTKGEKLASYNYLTGLAENDLVSLTTWKDKLYIGTRSKGLLEFNGKDFLRYWWPELKAEAISALLSDENRLLIGTFEGGLLEFDGNKFTEIKLDRKKIKAITWMEKRQQQIFLGTFDNGLWIIEPTKHQHFTTSQGLTSNRIIGITELNNDFFIATDFGLSLTNLENLNSQTKFQTALILPTLSSIVKTKNSLLLAEQTGKIWQLSLSKPVNHKYLELLADIPTNNAYLTLLENQVWLASNDGLWKLNENKIANFLPYNPNELSNNLVSSLAIDSLGQIWVGYFRNGIDVLSPKGQKLIHLENEYLHEINNLYVDQNNVLVATSQGLITFDNKFNAKRLSKSDGLLNQNISSCYKFPGSENLLLATAKGVAIGTKNKFSLLTKIQGLPSNNTYSLCVSDSSIYVATLTGLAKINNGKVTRTYKDANSNLKANWITALELVDKKLFVGTYGGGVYELTSTGELNSFTSELGKLVVNLNAMFSDNQRLYVGTLSGLWVYQLNNQRWYQVKAELPSSNVLSITGTENNIFVGTTNGIAKIEKTFFREIEKQKN